MSLSQPSRTIAVEPLQAAATAPPRADPPREQAPRRVEPPAPQAEAPART